MQQKLQTRAFERVAPALEPGERPVVATRTVVGGFSSGRLGAVAGQALLLEGAGGLGAAIASNAKQFVVLTDRRLIFLNQTLLGGPGSTVTGAVPRPAVRLVEVQMGLVSLLRIAFGPHGDGVALTFPRVDRKNAEALATALQQAPAR